MQKRYLMLITLSILVFSPLAVSQDTEPEAAQAVAVTVRPYEPTVFVKTYKPETGYTAGTEGLPTQNYAATVSSDPTISTTPVDNAPLRSYDSSTADRVSNLGV